MARWVVGVAGGVAAYKAVDLASRLVKEGHEVRVVMSEAATRFVTPLTFEAVTGRPVLFDLWAPGAGEAHIEIARWCDGIVVAPATADLIGQLANGLARDALGAVLLAARSPVWLAPAMHDAMWRHPAVQANVERLRQYGYRFIGPEHGRLASGEEGWGRMAEPAAIVDALRAASRA
ncbi:MAG: bifunctional 4'-phosphopantothenoylcysteine decarboxylase/phosphopantothenoylcysteine synthetase, partial [Clostridia bacterium]|nr:bifunctional 4'-phosphopantothenoylcysteine decarboxylase/phosphopantothenoylcysteine synthetase [Clostridia bacterium]